MFEFEKTAALSFTFMLLRRYCSAVAAAAAASWPALCAQGAPSGTDAGASVSGAPSAAAVAAPFPVHPASASPQFKRMADLVARFQDDITAAIERVDGVAKFREDRFPAPGASRIRVLQDGGVFEKAGVAVTVAQAPFKDRAEYFASRVPWVQKFLPVLPPQGFPMLAASISLVFHPHNPMVR